MLLYTEMDWKNKEKVISLLQRTGEMDSFEIAMLLLIPVDEVNMILEEINREGIVTVY
jgi:transcription initiation factor IIE alpha subunit